MQKLFLTVLALSMIVLMNPVHAVNKIKCHKPRWFCDYGCGSIQIPVNDFRSNKEKNNDVALTTKATWNAPSGYNQNYWNERCNTVYSHSCLGKCSASL